MGELHLEIYAERMKREYNCETKMGQPRVAYRETITKKANFIYVHKKQTGGAGQYAKIIGYMEPLPEDRKIDPCEFENATVGNNILPQYIPGIEKGFFEAIEKGPQIGHIVIGLRFVLTDGQYHPVDSSELAFHIAAQGAVRETFPNAVPILLEPVMKVEITIPTEFQATVISSLYKRGGVVMNTESQGSGFLNIVAEVPLSNMFGYSTDLRSQTEGKGEFSMEYHHYATVPTNRQRELMDEYKKKVEIQRKSGGKDKEKL